MCKALRSHVGADEPGEGNLAEQALERAALAHPLAAKISARHAALAPAQDGVVGAVGAIPGAAVSAAFDERQLAFPPIGAARLPTVGRKCVRG